MGENKQLKGIISLLDDTDVIVVKAINNHLLSKGVSIVEELEHCRRKERSAKLKLLIAQKIKFLTSKFALLDLRKIAQSKEPELLDGLIAISQLIGVKIQKDKFVSSLFSMSSQLQIQFNGIHTHKEKVDLFNFYFFKKMAFRSDQKLEFNKMNMLLNGVLEIRLGHPIVISILYFVFARIVGLPIYPLCFKGGLIPVYLDGNTVLYYLDLFRDGEIFQENQLIAFLNSQKSIDDPYKMVFEVREDKVLLVIYLEALAQMISTVYLKTDKHQIDEALNYFGDERFLTFIWDDNEEEDSDEL